MKKSAPMTRVLQSITAVVQGGVMQRSLTQPALHWWLGLVVMFMVGSGVVWWSVSTYLTYRNEIQIEIAAASAADQIYRATQVTAALAVMTTRHAERERLLAESTERLTTEVPDTTATTSTARTEPDTVPVGGNETTADAETVVEEIIDIAPLPIAD